MGTIGGDEEESDESESSTSDSESDSDSDEGESEEKESPHHRSAAAILVVASAAGCRVLLNEHARQFCAAHSLQRQCCVRLDVSNTDRVLDHAESCRATSGKLQRMKEEWAGIKKDTSSSDLCLPSRDSPFSLSRLYMYQGVGNVKYVHEELSKEEKNVIMRFLLTLQVKKHKHKHTTSALIFSAYRPLSYETFS